MAVMQCDVAIVGGGIMGCAAALALAGRGITVALFERGRLGAEQSSRAWGFVRQQGRHPAEIPLAREANARWRELTARFGARATGFDTAGILTPAETEADEARIAAAHADARAFQLQTRIISAAELRALLPGMAGSWRGALLTEGDGYAEPALATATIAEAARAAGATLQEGCPVLGLEREAGSVTGLLTTRGRVRAGAVLLANGVGAARLLRDVGLELPVQVVRSSVGRTTPVRPFTRFAMWGPRLAFRPRPDGRFVLGNGYRGAGGDHDLTPASFRHLRHFLPAWRRNWRQLRLALGRELRGQLAALGTGPAPEPPANRAKVEGNLRAFRALFPGLGEVGLEQAWAGRIDVTPDVIPVIDRPLPDQPLFVAAGFSGHGFALGPAVGQEMARWIADGRPGLDLSAFRLSRFAEGRAEAARQAL